MKKKVAPGWRKELEKKWRNPPPQSQPQGLRKGIRLLAEHAPKPDSLALPGQPFDSHLLKLSPLYKKSRQLYLSQKGSFGATLLSSPRSLSSAALLQNSIQYSPLESEYLWAATDPIQSRTLDHLLLIRSFVTNLFHEQNHRVLWNFLPAPPADLGDLQAYLNFVESLVVVADMALGDELEPKLAGLFYLTGTSYDPGTGVRAHIHSKLSRKDARRAYRNYLHAALHATWMNLEMLSEEDVTTVITSLHSHLGPLAGRAAERALRMDRQFVEKTNPFWQNRHYPEVQRVFGSRKDALILSADAMDNRLQYLWAEKWFDLLGI